MATITLSAFRGEKPIVSPRLLPEQNAQVARNLYLRRGTLQPERAPLAMAVLPGLINPSSIYRYPYGNNGAGVWFGWGGGKIVDVVKSPLASDDWKRVYWTGDGAPRMAPIALATQGAGPYPSNSYLLGVPVPLGTIGVVHALTDTEAPVTAVDCAYVVTLVSAYGEEGPPSSPSAAITRWDAVDDDEGMPIRVTLPTVPAGAHNIAFLRLYRAENNGTFNFVDDLPVGTAEYVDSVSTEALGVDCPSLTWDAPDARMIGLRAIGNGILCGFFDNTLCFSEAYRPHAWPVDYQMAFPDNIVGIGATMNGIVVATTGKPWLVTGSSPAAMSQTQLDTDLPCVSRGSVVDMGEYVLYAAAEGLVSVAGGQAVLITEGDFSRDQWQALQPSTMHAYRQDGRYLAFYDGGCFALAPGEGVEFLELSATRGYFDEAASQLYLLSGAAITAWRKGVPMAYRWRSKVFETLRANYACGKVIAAGYPVHLRILADGQEVMAADIPTRQMFRLPAGFADASAWEVEISGQQEVMVVQLASSPSELI